MRILEDAWHTQETTGPTVATVGNFDGLHRGQQRILETVLQRAAATGAEATVVTFEPHPLQILRPERPPQRLTTADQKRRLLELRGIDLLAVIDFTRDLATTRADLFVEDFLWRRLGIVEVYVGSHFGFGAGREGNLELLQKLGDRLGFEAVGISEVEEEGRIISSTRIRQAIRAGEVERASHMLGRPFAITGTVVHGEGRGHEQGWPTINIEPDHDLMPVDGVYASRVWIPSRRKVYEAVTNVGLRPTFADGRERVVESHLFDFGREVYEERVESSFEKRLRGERRFPSAIELVEQIALDAEAAREYLRRQSCSTFVPTLEA